MTKEVLIFGILFFAFMTMFNIFMAIKRKHSFTPAIVAFFMALAAVLFYFGQFLYGFISFAISVIVAVVKSNETSRALEKQFSQELEKTNIKEPLRIRDFLFWRGWVKVALRFGAKKAAMFYALFVVGIAIVIWSLFIILFPASFEDLFKKYLYLYAGLGIIIFFIYTSRALEKAIKNANRNG